MLLLIFYYLPSIFCISSLLLCYWFRYNKKFQWADGTIVYNNISIRIDQSFPYCGLLPPPFHAIIMQSCNLSDTALILCDVTRATTEPDVTGQHSAVIEEVKLTSRNQTDLRKFVICPHGHVTHDFLSCDALSSCLAVKEMGTVISTDLAWDVPSTTSCLTDVHPPPPSFPCGNGVQHVPYTLVCDHYDDCQDGSDERFCSFAPCTLDQLPCGSSQQVRCEPRPDLD